MYALPLPWLLRGLPPCRPSISGRATGVVAVHSERTRDMSILSWIIVGIAAGWLGRMVIPGEGPVGLFGDLVIGVVGAIIGVGSSVSLATRV
jgi:hypothetical protein